MSDTFEANLIECLDALDQGANMDALLARYPEDAAELRRALRVAGALSALTAQPTASAQEESRRKFLAAGVAMAVQNPPRDTRKAQSMRFGALVLRGAAILVAVIGAGAIPVAASGSALPGDPLYGVKRGVEDLQLGLAADPTAREAIATRNNARRIEEVDTLLHLRRDAQTGFEGRVDEATPESLTVSGVSITIPPGFNLPDLGVGLLVEVTVQVQDGQLILVEIHLVEQGAVIVPTLTPIPTPVPTRTPAPSPTREDSSGQGGIAPTDDETQEGDDGGEIEPTEDEGTDDGGGDDGGEVEPTEDEGDDDSGGSGSNSGSGGGDDGGGDDSSGGDDGGDDN